MKGTIILLVAIIALSACYKKSTSNRKNFYCVKNDSMYSNYPLLANPHFKVIKGNYNQINQAQMDFVVKSNTYTDTFFFRHDTLQQEFWTMSCTQID